MSDLTFTLATNFWSKSLEIAITTFSLETSYLRILSVGSHIGIDDQFGIVLKSFRGRSLLAYSNQF